METLVAANVKRYGIFQKKLTHTPKDKLCHSDNKNEQFCCTSPADQTIVAGWGNGHGERISKRLSKLSGK